jgi:hypothetical protein
MTNYSFGTMIPSSTPPSLLVDSQRYLSFFAVIAIPMRNPVIYQAETSSDSGDISGQWRFSLLLFSESTNGQTESSVLLFRFRRFRSTQWLFLQQRYVHGIHYSTHTHTRYVQRAILVLYFSHGNEEQILLHFDETSFTGTWSPITSKFSESVVPYAHSCCAWQYKKSLIWMHGVYEFLSTHVSLPPCCYRNGINSARYKTTWPL